MGHPRPIPTALTIAGSDPSGGAGIQADLKAFSALGAYGMSVICALTAQDTQGVSGVFSVPPAFVGEQLDTLVADIEPDAIKIGMLATPEIVDVVADFVRAERERRPGFDAVVLDPVMVATSGDRLLAEAAIDAVRRLVPLASLITPNLPEAAVLLDAPVATGLPEMREQAAALVAAGANRVVLKAGYLIEHEGARQAIDIYADADGLTELAAERVETRHTHGTGCSLSSAIAALRPQRDDWLTAVRDAKSWLTGALRHADELGVGHGHGPVHHFYELWDR